MRTFVAVFPPPEVREGLIRAARNLRVEGDVRWTKPENVHLTIKFLGEVPEASLEDIGDAIREVAGRHGSFEMETEGFGAFPSVAKARVLWAGIGEGAAALRALAVDVENTLETLGFEKEGRGYTPHFTLGRARGRPVKFIPTEEVRPGSRFTARRLELVRSASGVGGVGYSTLKAYGLSKSRSQRSDGHDDEE